MIQCCDIWCEAERTRCHTFEEYRNYKAKKSVFRAGHRRCVNAFISDIDRDLQDAAIHESAFLENDFLQEIVKVHVPWGRNIFYGTVYRGREDLC